MHFNRTALLIGFAILLLAGSTVAPLSAGEDKTLQLENLTVRFSAVRRQLSERLAAAEAKRGEIEAFRTRLAAEVRSESRNLETVQLRQALQQRPLELALRLLQRSTAYGDQLGERIGYFRSALETLDFFERQIRAEIAFLKTVSRNDVAGLAGQIRAALDEYTEQAAMPLLRMSAISERSLEAVWNEVSDGGVQPESAVAGPARPVKNTGLPVAKSASP